MCQTLDFFSFFKYLFFMFGEINIQPRSFLTSIEKNPNSSSSVISAAGWEDSSSQICPLAQKKTLY